MSLGFGWRLLMVLLTYATRPLCWGVSLAMLTAWILLLVRNDDSMQSNSPQVEVQTSRIYSMTDLQNRIDSGKQDSITDVHYGNIWKKEYFELTARAEANGRTPNPKVIEQQTAKRLAAIETLPNLARLQTAHPVNSAMIQQFSRMSNLRELRLMAVGIDRNLLQLLPDVRQLQRLEIRLSSPLPSLAPLAELPQLHSLMLTNCGGFTVERFDEIARLRHLKSLVLPNPEAHRITPEMVERLRGMPELTDVYVQVPPERTASLSMMQQALPDVTVHRGYYRPLRVYGLLGGLYVMLALTFAMMQAVGQFSLPQSKVIPNYAVPHQAAALIPALIASSAHAGMLWVFKAHWIPAWSAMLFFYGLIVWTQLASETIPLVRRSAALSISMVLFCGTGPLVLFATVPSWAELAEAFLLSEYPIVTFGLLAVGGLMVFDSLRRLPDCHNFLAEARLPPVLVMKDLQSAHMAALNDVESFVMIGLTTQDRAIVRAIDGGYHQGSFWRCLKLWRAAVPARRATLALILIGPIMIAWMALPIWSKHGSLLVDGRWLSFAGVLYLITGGMIVIVWWQNLLSIANSLTWPLTRRTMIRDVFSAIAADLLVPSLLILLVIAGWFYVDRDAVTGMALLAASVGSLGIVALTHSIGVWMITIRRIWVLIVFACLAESFFAGLVFALIVPINSNSLSSPTPARIAAVGLTACVVAAISTSFAWRRWLRLEFGLE